MSANDKTNDGFSALGSSKYVKVEIKKTIKYGKASSTSEEHDIKGKVTDIRYYESLYSPVVSGALIYVNAGDSLRSTIPLCLLYTSPSPRDRTRSRMPSSA